MGRGKEAGWGKGRQSGRKLWVGEGTEGATWRMNLVKAEPLAQLHPGSTGAEQGRAAGRRGQETLRHWGQLKHHICPPTNRGVRGGGGPWVPITSHAGVPKSAHGLREERKLPGKFGAATERKRMELRSTPPSTPLPPSCLASAQSRLSSHHIQKPHHTQTLCATSLPVLFRPLWLQPNRGPC